MRVIEPIIKPRLLTAREAGVYLGKSILAIRELQWRGELPFIKIGRRVSFDIHDLDRFIEENKIRNSR